MLSGAVSLVSGETVSRIPSVGADHDLIAGDLGQDACSGDGERFGISLHDAPARQGTMPEVHPIKEQGIGLGPQRRHRREHGLEYGIADADAIDVVGLDMLN